MTELAPAGRYAADPNHSSVLFRIKHLGLAWYTGRFTRVAATLDIDPAAPESALLDATVELRSVRAEYMGTDKDWDAELAESDTFLDAAKQPTARFVSNRIERRGDDRALVHGDLSLRGHTNPFIFDTTFNGALLTHWSGVPMVGFSATGIMKRSEYGLTFNVGPLMPDEVQIIVEAEFAKAEQ